MIEEDGEDARSVTATFDTMAQALEGLGIDFPALLEIASREVEAIEERREAEELGIPLAEFLKQFPDTANEAAEKAKHRLLSEIRGHASSLSPRGRNWMCGYLGHHFPELADLFPGQMNLSGNAAWGEKLEEIIDTALRQPSWPIILGKLYMAIDMMGEVARRMIPSVTIAMGTVGTTDLPVVIMTIGGNSYVMLTIKKNALAVAMIAELKSRCGVSAIAGMAFNYQASRNRGELISSPDASMTGVYVESGDLPRVLDLFNQ